jgi:uncharacterized repeat protein (TIGR03806 family)
MTPSRRSIESQGTALRTLKTTLLAATLCAGGLASGCGGTSAPSGPYLPGGDGTYVTALYPTLEQYGVVSIKDGAVVPADGVVAYELNTPLFSDYTVKYRTVWMPKGKSVAYDAANALDFPVGTIVTKSFGFRDDLRKSAPSIKWIETRVFVKQDAGWKGVSYAWNDAQTAATANYGGGAVPVSWTDEAGAKVDLDYVVPNGNQCTICHSKRDAVTNTDVTTLIGPKIRNLNRDHAYASGSENQLAYWVSVGMLTGAPADLGTAPKLASWTDTSATVAQRARAYLDVNCAHCHSEKGFARTTGLYLDVTETRDSSLGFCKPPVAVGAASGGFLYDVVPGDPDHSILTYRLATTAASVMMPQIGRGVVDKAGTQLVRDWVTGLKGTTQDCVGH